MTTLPSLSRLPPRPRTGCLRLLQTFALHAECRAVDFFDWVARTTPHEGVRTLARGMADEEREHVDWVMKAIEREVVRASR